MSFCAAAARRAAPVLRRSLHTQAARADFGWNKLVTPQTNPAFIARMKELDSKFLGMKTEMFGVPEQVESVDWAQYEKGISNKATFAAIKKEYETMVFPEVKGEDLTKINADLDFSISKASVAAEISKGEIARLKSELAAAIAEKKAVHTWTMDDYFARYPGLEEQLRAEYMNGDYLPTDAEERLESQDVAEARKAFKTGAEIVVPDDLPDRVGDWSLEAEKKKVDAMLEKMFGGSKAFEAAKLVERAAEAKKAAAAAHH